MNFIRHIIKKKKIKIIDKKKNTIDLVDILIDHSYNVSIETSNAVSIKGINLF